MLIFRKSSIEHVLPIPSRCLFCLSRVCHVQTFLDETPNFESLPNCWDKLPVNQFHNVWKHLLSIQSAAEDGDRFTFPETPPLCSDCGGWLEKISSALEQLSNATNVIMETVKSCGESGVHSKRLYELLEDMKAASVLSETWAEALHLLETIGHEPFKETDLRVAFSVDSEQESARIKEEPEVKEESEAYACAASGKDFPSDGDEWNWNEKLAPGGSPMEDDGERDTSEEEDNDDDDGLNDESIQPTTTTSRRDPIEDADLLADTGAVDEEFCPGSDGDSLDNEIMKEKPQIRSKSTSGRKNSRSVKYSRKPPSSSLAYMKPCDFCGKDVHIDNLLEHVRGHVGDYARICPNPNCRQAFSCIPAWERHTRHILCRKFISEDPLKCELCGYCSPKFVSLSKHLPIHETSHRPYLCPVSGCHQRFTVSQSVRCHIYTHAISISKISRSVPLGKQPDKYLSQSCDFCREVVPLNNILEHVSGHVADYALPCPNPNCRKVYSNPSSLWYHLRKTNLCTRHVPKEQIGSNHCEICGHSSSSTFSLLVHLKAVHETDQKPFLCPVADCTERFTHRQTVQHHISYHTVPLDYQPIMHKCEFCEKSFAKIRMLNLHEKSHNATKAKPFSCDMPGCSKRFSKLHGLSLHKGKETHADPGNPHKCHHCKEEFILLSKLQRHLLSRHREKMKISKLPTGRKELVEPEKVVTRTRCPDCPDDETLRNYSTMRNHRIAMHGADPYKCALCGETFLTDSQYKAHNKTHKAVEEEPKQYICELPGCGKVFKTNQGLTHHKSSVEHLGRTNAAVCGQCGKGFNFLNQLKAHEKLVHGTERKYVCDDCGESFKSGTVLKRHKLIHTGERPFQCDICQQSFRYKEVLRRHLESHKRKGASFRPNGPMKHLRKRVDPK